MRVEPWIDDLLQVTENGVRLLYPVASAGRRMVTYIDNTTRQRVVVRHQGSLEAGPDFNGRRVWIIPEASAKTEKGPLEAPLST